jgi:SPP1 family predicted phage head-tail adaptor
MRQRITLQQLGEVADSVGQPVQAWTDVLTVWARVLPLHGTEAMVAQQIRGTASHEITMRDPGDSYPITPQHRFIQRAGFAPTPITQINGGRVLNVVSVRDYNANRRELRVIAEEVV